MRSPLWFVLAGVIAIASLVGAALHGWSRKDTVDAGMIRVVVPGSTVITLDKPGDYTIYHEQQSYVDGELYASDSIAGLRVALVGEGGAAVKLRVPVSSSSYSIGSRKGSSIFIFTISQPGRYRLTTTLAGDRSEPKAVLAIDQGMMGRLFALIGATLAIVFGGIAVAGIIVIVTLLQRSRAAKGTPA